MLHALAKASEFHWSVMLLVKPAGIHPDLKCSNTIYFWTFIHKWGFLHFSSNAQMSSLCERSNVLGQFQCFVRWVLTKSLIAQRFPGSQQQWTSVVLKWKHIYRHNHLQLFQSKKRFHLHPAITLFVTYCDIRKYWLRDFLINFEVAAMKLHGFVVWNKTQLEWWAANFIWTSTCFISLQIDERNNA